MPLRLVAYDTNGNRRGAIQAPLKFTWHNAFNGVPSLTVSWTEHAPTHSLLQGPCYVALEQHNSGEWIEMQNARFFVAKQAYDRRDPTAKNELTLPGMVGLLSGAKVWDTNLNEEGKRVFDGVTVGDILLTLIGEAQARGALPMLEIEWSEVRDSWGNYWTEFVHREYDPSVDLLAVLDDFASAGFLDFSMYGNTLNIMVADTSNRDLSGGTNPVWLRESLFTSSPEEETYTDLANGVLVVGDDDFRLSRSTTAADTPYGRRETVVKVAGVRGEDVAGPLANRTLAAGSEVARTCTRQWTYSEDEPYVPMPARDFLVGDWVAIDTAVGRRQRMRVADMSLTLEQDNTLTAFVGTGVVRDDPVVRLIKDQKNLSAGAKPGKTGIPKGLINGASIVPGTIPADAVDLTGVTDLANDYTDSLVDPLTDRVSALEQAGGGHAWDERPTAGSTNGVYSRGIYLALYDKQDKLVFDNTPTAGSSNPVTSAGIKAYIDENLPPPDLSNMTLDQAREAVIGFTDDTSIVSPHTAYFRRTLAGWSGKNPIWDLELNIQTAAPIHPGYRVYIKAANVEFETLEGQLVLSSNFRPWRGTLRFTARSGGKDYAVDVAASTISSPLLLQTNDAPGIDFYVPDHYRCEWTPVTGDNGTVTGMATYRAQWTAS